MTSVVTIKQSFETGSGNLKEMFQAVSLTQFFLSIVVLIFSTVERYPVSLFNTNYGGKQSRYQIKVGNKKFEQSSSWKETISHYLRGDHWNFSVCFFWLKIKNRMM